ncbi:unnamed protein product [Arctia plantaginis]|uniref:Uncharacterized protein n=1 Tax=Arctia plantaginis TaxID=874455 RepID=A0A8S1B2A3_ARCPL|nr:unnamed protein product [Arctia plantaginis]
MYVIQSKATRIDRIVDKALHAKVCIREVQRPRAGDGREVGIAPGLAHGPRAAGVSRAIDPRRNYARSRRDGGEYADPLRCTGATRTRHLQ